MSGLLLVMAATTAPALRDLHESCQQWAETGECAANENFMRDNCALSCSKARDFKSQIRKECDGYAKQGECSRNPAFMLSTCRAECDAWEKQHGLKIDRNSLCVEWSMLGKCLEEDGRPSAKMAVQCNTSCTVHERCARSTFTGWSLGVCDKALRCEPKDQRTDCAARAARGECAASPTKMAVECLQSCSSLDVDSVLAAQRPEMRAILSPHYDLPVPLARAHERCYLPGWSGHNHFKLMLPTECAAPRTMPWHRQRTPALRWQGDTEDALTCPLDVKQTTPRVPQGPRRSPGFRKVSILPHTPHEVTIVQVMASPRIRLLRDFLTAEEAAEIIRIAEPLFHRSPVRSVAQDRRTSSTATLGGGLLGGVNWAVKNVRARISAFSG